MEIWNLDQNFTTAPADQVLQQLWAADGANQIKFTDELPQALALIDQGLQLFLEPLQAAHSDVESWKGRLQLRASIAMLKQTFNLFLAQRHLLTMGYLSESRILKRHIHESLTAALAYNTDEKLAQKFYKDHHIAPKAMRSAVATAFGDENTAPSEIHQQFEDQYKNLSKGSHPTLNSLVLRTATSKPGIIGLQEAVPERVFVGGVLFTELGYTSSLGMAQDIGDALATVGFIIHEEAGSWNKSRIEYTTHVQTLIKEDTFTELEPNASNNSFPTA